MHRRLRREGFPSAPPAARPSPPSRAARGVVSPGFRHSAFTFGHESAVSAEALGGPALPGALVGFVQKGLQYLELESNLTEARRRGCVASRAGLSRDAAFLLFSLRTGRTWTRASLCSPLTSC